MSQATDYNFPFYISAIHRLMMATLRNRNRLLPSQSPQLSCALTGYIYRLCVRLSFSCFTTLWCV